MRKLIVTIAVVSLFGGLAALGVSVATGSSGVSAAGTKSVNIVDFAYQPHKFSIKRKTKVKWTWAGMSDHTVTQADKHFNPKSHGFSSQEMSTGTYSHTFKRAGTYYIVCMVHPTQMHMKIVVR
jgi:plastocyanin